MASNLSLSNDGDFVDVDDDTVLICLLCCMTFPSCFHSSFCRKFYSRNICQDPRRILHAAGELCVARYSKDSKWYRARITSVREADLQVSGLIEPLTFPHRRRCC